MFGVKIISGNTFSEMRLFGWSGKFYFPEIEIRWPKKKVFDHEKKSVGGWNDKLYFSLMFKWERNKDKDDSTCKSHFQICTGIMEWNLSFVEAICWLMAWVMALIGYDDEWNIFQSTHTKLVQYCFWEGCPLLLGASYHWISR